jgi:deazaflavin-dependent oxidoreductase (nitroreductase family)
MLFGQEHVNRYVETEGAVGHEWQPGVYTLLLTTTGRRSGRPFTTPLIYRTDGDAYVVVASKGGADHHPDWYRNLEAHPEFTIQVGDQVLRATATTVQGEERARLWTRMAEVWPPYDDYAAKTERPIPVVALIPTD